MKDREIDVLVAEKIMGWHRNEIGCWRDGDHPARNIVGREYPHYSTDIAAAFLVVEKLTRGRTDIFSLHRTGDRWGARFRDIESSEKPDFSEANIPPKAIVIAALSALGVGVGA